MLVFVIFLNNCFDDCFIICCITPIQLLCIRKPTGFFLRGFFCTKCLKKIILLIFILPSCALILWKIFFALALMLLVTNYVCNKVAVFCFEF